MVVEPFQTWSKSSKPASAPKPKPTREQLDRWTASYAAADAGSLGTKPKTSGPPESPSTVTRPSSDTIVTDTAPAADPSPKPTPDTSNLTSPSPFQLTDPAAAQGFVASQGLGSLVEGSRAIRNRTETREAAATAALESGMGSAINHSQGLPQSRPPLPAAVAAEEHGDQHAVTGGDRDEAIVIVWPEDGGYYRHEYIWNEQIGDWELSAYEWGGSGGETLGRQDLLNPQNDYRNRPEREDRRSAYERMQEHYDPEGNRYQYPNTIWPGMFPDGPIAPNYDNYPSREDALIGSIAGVTGWPTELSAETALGLAITAVTLGPTTPLELTAGTALSLANRYQGAPREDGVNPSNMSPEGRPLTGPERNISS